MLGRFVGLERVDSSRLSDVRLARKAGGFAFEVRIIMIINIS